MSLRDQRASADVPAAFEVDTAAADAVVTIPSGIAPLDERVGGLRRGGSYLVVGTPGPAKMVAAHQFLIAGLEADEPGLLLTNADPENVLDVARAWGFDFEPHWHTAKLQILGFKDDFELRAIRSIEPEEVVEELELLAGPEPVRITVDPGSLFLSGGVKSLLGSTFLKWARRHPATVLTTLSVDVGAGTLPSAADWMLHATTGRLMLECRADDLYQLTLLKDVPDPDDREEPVSVQLKPRRGLVAPDGLPARRGRDRAGVDERRLLLISLGGEHAEDVEAWAKASFEADVVSEPFEAVARVQGDAAYGGVMVHAPRARVREAAQACRAIRPLTRAAIVFASDDAVRSTDRIQILEAGADDCLSGGIDFRELDMRIRQAIAAGSKPPPSTSANDNRGARRAVPEGGRVSVENFRAELRRRAADPVQTFFCLLDVAGGGLAPDDLERLLAEHVRLDEGDLVSRNGHGCYVLLHGARQGQLDPFLTRLRARIGERAGAKKGDADVELDVLGHPSEATRIQSLLGIEGARDE